LHNPIQVIFQRIHWAIPEEILQITFQHKLGKEYYSIDHAIHEEIIIHKVLPECNLFAGNVKYIFLEDQYRLHTPPPQQGYNAYFTDTIIRPIYKIPPDVREYRSIVNVVKVAFPSAFGLYPNGMSQINSCGRGPNIQQMACDVLTSKTGQADQLPFAKLIGGDMIELSYLTYPFQTIYNLVAEVRLEYDVNFMNINNQSVIPLAELIECALKCYIYNKLIIRLDKGALEGGIELGMIKQIIDDYKSAFEEYKDKLNAFIGGATLSHERINSILKSIL
jgi:hypothetical protein